VSVPFVVFSLLLSLGSAAPKQNDLRISIARVETADSKPSNPAFAITLDNQGEDGLQLVLGYRLGQRMFPEAITLLVTDSRGRTSWLHYHEPVKLGARIDDYIVALRPRASYVLRVSLAQYRSPFTGEGRDIPPVEGPLDPKLSPGFYSVQATFGGQPARSGNSDMQGLGVMTFWTGTVSSNVLRFSVAETQSK
jgi:hypothetical protein